jgi:hypothetical protein
MALGTVNHHPPARRTQKAGLDDETAQCPYCGRPLARQQFKEIQARIEAEERARITKVEQSLRDRFARDVAQAEAKKKAEIEKSPKGCRQNRRDADQGAKGESGSSD